MTDYEPPPRPRPKHTKSGPGIFVNVEFGVSFNSKPSRPPHTASLSYTSKRMASRLLLQRREQDALPLEERNHRHPFEQPLWSGPHPSTLTPGDGEVGYGRYRQHRDRRRESQQYHERAGSAPPDLNPWTEQQMGLSPVWSVQHTSSMPLEGMERPLPPLPSQYRLGESGLPWSTEPWYRPDSPANTGLPSLGFERETPMASTGSSRRNNSRGEDPQRERELEDLHLAMLSVDSLPHDGWETWTWEDGVGDMPRGPRSLGWAVRSDSPATVMSAGAVSPPPAYASQYESSWWDTRPRSSGT